MVGKEVQQPPPVFIILDPRRPRKLRPHSIPPQFQPGWPTRQIRNNNRRSRLINDPLRRRCQLLLQRRPKQNPLRILLHRHSPTTLRDSEKMSSLPGLSSLSSKDKTSLDHPAPQAFPANPLPPAPLSPIDGNPNFPRSPPSKASGPLPQEQQNSPPSTRPGQQPPLLQSVWSSWSPP